jgi:hypothetical protein
MFRVHYVTAEKKDTRGKVGSLDRIHRISTDGMENGDGE